MYRKTVRYSICVLSNFYQVQCHCSLWFIWSDRSLQSLNWWKISGGNDLQIFQSKFNVLQFGRSDGVLPRGNGNVLKIFYQLIWDFWPVIRNFLYLIIFGPHFRHFNPVSQYWQNRQSNLNHNCEWAYKNFVYRCIHLVVYLEFGTRWFHLLDTDGYWYSYKLSLVGMQLPGKYKENFDVLSEDPSSGVTKGFRSKRRNSPYNFQVVSSLSMKACSYYGTDSSRFRVSCSCMNYSSSLHSNGETCTCQYGFRIRPSDPVIYWAHYSENASI
jgi:hypothetical protein